jgi:hypothetical protein
MLHGAMLIQHSLQVVGVVWVATAFRRPGRILLVSAAASLGTSYGLFSHGLFTEGLANPLLLLFLGALLRLWRDGPTRTVMLLLALTLLLASLSRHVLIVLAGMPVLFLLLQPCCGIGCATAGARSGSRSCWPSALSGPTARSTPGCRCCWMRRPPPCSAAPPSTASKRLISLCRPASAPTGWPRCRRAPMTRKVRAALPPMATVDNPWTGPRDALSAQPALYGSHPDVLMTAGFSAFWLWPNAWVWTQWVQEFSGAAFGPEPWGSASGQVQPAAAGIRRIHRHRVPARPARGGGREGHRHRR